MSNAYRRLLKEYKELLLKPCEGISAGPINEDNLFEWEAVISGPVGTLYENGVFIANISFPSDYPLNPPKMKFKSEMWHPNIFKDGTVCISILHAPGEDPNQYELSSERWSPVQSIEKILLSVISILAEPNDESPANIDSAKMWRTDKERFKEVVLQTVKKSLDLD
eukprot:TRINITY_DN2814_c0_g1_i1.p1 TRINITY_DN2814_c0_g1~~TRINITY_DN2814_c0_g1_i1.p1  ORF type:complete len:166 (-),score=30.92 TRINITY_DN2814_c0_g1_i1:132-629(-)